MFPKFTAPLRIDDKDLKDMKEKVSAGVSDSDKVTLGS